MYRNAVELEPHNATAWTDLANAENACGNRLAARRYYERAIELDSQSIDALFNFAAFLYNLEERALALVLIDRALALDPTMERHALYANGFSIERLRSPCSRRRGRRASHRTCYEVASAMTTQARSQSGKRTSGAMRH